MPAPLPAEMVPVANEPEMPAGAEPIVNDRGTAPGIWMSVGVCLVVAMPGVPGSAGNPGLLLLMLSEERSPLIQEL